jgi:L-alanine-DL-glutamate epimerase-like enolase superfamily enzyme
LESDGYVTIPELPGLGYDIEWNYIDEHRIPDVDVEALAPLHPR